MSLRDDWEHDLLRCLALHAWMLEVVVPEDTDACWGWTGRTHRGYPHASVETPAGQRWWDMKQVALAIRLGRPCAEGMLVRHRCPEPNPACTNPWHLLEGTCLQNVRDSINDGTYGGKP